jgi:hypothetical protein
MFEANLQRLQPLMMLFQNIQQNGSMNELLPLLINVSRGNGPRRVVNLSEFFGRNNLFAQQRPGLTKDQQAKIKTKKWSKNMATIN